MESKRHRLLSIGEFAAATQLTPKALRLYDEQNLLRPATIDSASGYRYFNAEQVPVGRLIRALRDMSLSLQQISQLLNVEPNYREFLLRQFVQEAERQYLQQKRAYQSVLAMMRRSQATAALTIEQSLHEGQIVSVWSFAADRYGFVQRYFEQYESASQCLNALGIAMCAEAGCALLEPLTDEEGRLELLVPIAVPTSGNLPAGITTRKRLAGRHAAVAVSLPNNAAALTAAIDALFDWFDRHGLHARECPEVTLMSRDDGIDARVRWAFEAARYNE